MELILSRKLKSKFILSNNTLKPLNRDKRAILTKEEDLLSLGRRLCIPKGITKEGSTMVWCEKKTCT